MSEFQYTPEKIKFLEEDTVDIRQILETVWGLRFWILLSLIVCFGIAYAYCLYKTPVYETSCSIMLVSEEGSKGAITSEFALMSEFSGMSLQQKMSNELYILKTTSLMQNVVEELNLNIQYFEKERIKSKEFYKNSPLLFQWENPVPLAASEIQHMEIHLTLQSENESFIINEFLIKGEEVFLGIRNYAFGEIISTSAGLFSINRVPNMTTNHDTFLIIVTSPRAKARQISDRLTVSQISQGRSGLSNSSDIILLSLQEEIPQRSSDILNALIINYINDTRNFKAASVNKSIAFINGRLTEIEKDLGIIESDYSSYRVTRGIVQEASQSQIVLTSDARYRDELTELELQISLLNMVKGSMLYQESDYDMVPANLGLKDLGLTAGIEQYNNLVIERNRLLAGSSLSNPRVINANLQLKDLREGINMTIDNVEKTYKLRIDALHNQISRGKRDISNIPTQQLELARLERRQEIIEPLYRLLQQKKEENMISLYALPDNARMMEVPYTKVTPIKPNKRNICLMGLLLGIMIPPGIFFIKESLRRKVYGKQDVEKRTKLPVFAIIPKAKDDIILVDFKNKDKITEAFRMLRANMQFLEGKVIQVTSSIAGEGKSTISTNLAIALASIGKKVILVGMDLRKPKIHKIFDISNKAGVTSFLIGKETDVSNLITPSKVHENLHVMTAGPIPPNPSELLSTSKVSELLKPLTNNYDFIIMDTSPCFLAADTFNIARYSDITLYVIRSKMADLRMIPQIQEFHDTGKLPKVSLVINAVNFSKNAYGHGYGYGYCYGYGYGVEENEKRKKRLN